MNDIYSIAIQAAIKAGEGILDVYYSDDFQITKKDDKSPLTKADKAAHRIIVSLLEQTGIPILSEEGRDIPYNERSDWESFWLVDPLDGTKEFIKRNGEFTVNIALITFTRPVFGVVFAPVLENLYVGIPGEGAWLLKSLKEVVTMEQLKASGTPLPCSGLERKSAARNKVVASRSHLNADTEQYLEQVRAAKGELEIVSKGSSLKLCMVASGEANIYPRLGPTMEWDVAAAHAVVAGAGKHVFRIKKAKSGEEKWKKDGELRYNKENLLNPYFLVV